MSGPLAATASAQPEKLLDGLRHRLTTHALWEALLLFLPPLLALCYIAFFLYRLAWLGADAVLAGSAALLCVAVALAAWRFRSLLPSPRLMARLIDDRAKGEDRFVTLATIDPALWSPLLLSHLRFEATSLVPRVHLKRDFPFRLPRSFLNSCIGSLVVILLFHLFLGLAPAFGTKARVVEELALLSQRLSSDTRFEKLAEGLKTVLAQLQEPALSKEQKRSLIEELLKRMKAQIGAEQQQTGGDPEPLRQAADLLSRLEQELKEGHGKGAGEGQSFQDRGGAGNQKSDRRDQKQDDSTLPTSDLAGSTASKLTRPEGKEKELRGAGKENQEGGKDAKERGKDNDLERGEKEGTETKGAGGERELKPTGPTPQRFLQPGEHGQAGLKDPRFVIVELPEEEIEAESGGASGGTRKKSAVARPPVGNLPLRQPDTPEASPEKQKMPLEYRGMIR